MATLSDVAQLAGVTTATVSNVLRNPQKVKASTVLKVQAAIATTGYRPNLMARALAEGKSSMVALVVPGHHQPVLPRVCGGGRACGAQPHYFLMVCTRRIDRHRPGLPATNPPAPWPAACWYWTTGITPEDVAQISNRRAPIVLASNEAIHYSEQVPHVVLNLHRAGEIAGQHLVELGPPLHRCHRRLRPGRAANCAAQRI